MTQPTCISTPKVLQRIRHLPRTSCQLHFSDRLMSSEAGFLFRFVFLSPADHRCFRKLGELTRGGVPRSHGGVLNA